VNKQVLISYFYNELLDLRHKGWVKKIKHFFIFHHPDYVKEKDFYDLFFGGLLKPYKSIFLIVLFKLLFFCWANIFTFSSLFVAFINQSYS